MPGMILKEGKPFAALGLKGGHVQPQVQVQIIINLIDFGMTVQESIAAPRFNHIEGVKLGLEPGISEATVRELKRRGHQIVSGASESFGGASRHHDLSLIRCLCWWLRPAQRRLRRRIFSTQKKFCPTAKISSVQIGRRESISTCDLSFSVIIRLGSDRLNCSS